MTKVCLRLMAVAALAAGIFFVAPAAVQANERFADIRQEDLIPPRAYVPGPPTLKVAELTLVVQFYWFNGRQRDAVRVYEGLARVYSAQVAGPRQESPPLE